MGNLFNSNKHHDEFGSVFIHNARTSSSGLGNSDRKKKIKQASFILLGSGETGKSTLFKQIKIFFQNAQYTPEEIMVWKASIYSNLLVTIQALCTEVKNRGLQFESDEIEEAADRLSKIETEGIVKGDYSQSVHRDIELVWSDENIKSVFKSRGTQFYVFDGAEYFFSDLGRLKPPYYSPSAEDILRCRRKTTGVVKERVMFGEYEFIITDVGGQRNERRKWYNNPEDLKGLSGIIFVAALSDYCQVCYEDGVTNRMDEALDTFEQIINKDMFRDIPIVLLLNKTDKFREYLLNADLSRYFPEYIGGNSYEKACEFIKNQFIERNKRYDAKRISIHFICVTDRGSIQTVFGYLVQALQKHNLQHTKPL